MAEQVQGKSVGVVKKQIKEARSEIYEWVENNLKAEMGKIKTNIKELRATKYCQ